MATATNFRTIKLEPQSSAEQPFAEFVKTLLEKLDALQQDRSSYYERLRQINAKWANGSRWFLALLGSIAFLLTSLAAALRFKPDGILDGLAGYDKLVLLLVLAIYAVMGAISFYEKGTDKTTAYFRHVGSIFAIRDLWTKVQFELLKELMAWKSAPNQTAVESAARERIRSLAEAFCNDLNKTDSGELTQWRTDFLASLSELEAVAKKGSDDVTNELQEAVKTAEKAAVDAKSAAEQAANDAKAAAKLAEDAAKPGGLNLTVAGDFDDQIVISVDAVEVARSRGKIIAVERVTPGMRRISAQAKKGSKELEASYMVDVKPGLQNFTLTLA